MIPRDASDSPTADFRGLLLALRGRAGLTQRELATLVGRSVRAITAWEAGDSYPSAGALQALAAHIAHQVAPRFDAVYWRSLRNAPPPAEWLAGAVLFLSAQQLLPAEGEEARLRQLLELLRERRSLLVLDNLETVLEPGATEIRYRAGYVGYGQMLQLLGEVDHQSCLVVTSRELPPDLRPGERAHA